MTVLLIILAIIVVILIIPFGVSAAYSDGDFSLAARVLFLKFRLFPQKPKKEKPAKPKKEKKPKKPPKRRPDDDPEAEKKKRLEKIFQLARVGLDALGRFRRKLTVNSFKLYVVSASDDPFNAAMVYGGLNTVLSVLVPMAESAFNIRKRDIRTAVSFETTEPVIDFAITLTISLGRILAIVFVAGFTYLKLRIKANKEKRRALRAEERMDQDGSAQPNV